MIGPICYERHKIIDTFWDYFSIQDSEVIIFYHYWTHTDGKSTPKYNMSSIKIHMEE